MAGIMVLELFVSAVVTASSRSALSILTNTKCCR